MRKVRFYRNQIFDEIMTDQFLDIKGGGVDFGKGIIKEHPSLKEALLRRGKKTEIIRSYLNNYYKTHSHTIDAKIDAIKNAWEKKEREYASITESYFQGFPFPAGKYIAYASVINCNPRFLDQKTFQFFYKKSVAEAVYTIAHELLHFIFFDFVECTMKKEIAVLSEDQIWDLSEIFNIIVLRSPRYKGIVDPTYVLPYPNHKKWLPKFEKAYRETANAKDFIRRAIKIIK